MSARLRSSIVIVDAADFEQRLSQDLPHALAAPAQTDSRQEPLEKAEKGARKPVSSGTLLVAEAIVEVAHYIRERLGYRLLSHITAVDYLSDGEIEVLYHFMHLSG